MHIAQCNVCLFVNKEVFTFSFKGDAGSSSIYGGFKPKETAEKKNENRNNDKATPKMDNEKTHKSLP